MVPFDDGDRDSRAPVPGRESRLGVNGSARCTGAWSAADIMSRVDTLFRAGVCFDGSVSSSASSSASVILLSCRGRLVGVPRNC